MSTSEDRLDLAVKAAGVSPLSEAALQRLSKAAHDELAAHPKARPWWMDGLTVLALNLVMGVGASAAMTWSDLQHASMTMRSVIVIGWLVVMAVGSVLWLKPGGRMGRWLVAGGFGVTSLLAIAGASGFDPGGPFFRGMGCAFTECALATIPVAVVLALSTRFAASASHLFVGGLAAGSAGALALHLHCTNGTVAHLVMFHLLPAVVLGGLAALLHRFLRPRAFVP